MPTKILTSQLARIRTWLTYNQSREEAIAVTDAGSLLRQAELAAEKTSAVIRLIVFLFLALAIFAAAHLRGATAVPGIATGLYGAGAGAGVLLAWRRIFHPVIPYLFVTFDMLLVVVQLELLAGMMGMQPSLAFHLPATMLIFVFLIHAAMRYRPWLVVYAAGLFILSVEAAPLFVASVQNAPMTEAMSKMPGMSAATMAGMLNFQLLPPALISLATFILFVSSRRTRALLMTSIEQITRTAKLSRYFSPSLAVRLAEGDDAQLLAGRRQSSAVLFVDIRGFSALGETMRPDELGAFLSEYRSRLSEPVFAHGGIVDKFIGDAIMIVFGVPVPRLDDAKRALDCAFDIIDAAERWSAERQRAGGSPVSIGVGAHYGEVFAGALGSEQLWEYTVIGDTVNVAERLEGLSREIGCPIVASAALLRAAVVSDKSLKWRALPSQQLRGHRQPVEAFYLAPVDRNKSGEPSIDGQRPTADTTERPHTGAADLDL